MWKMLTYDKKTAYVLGNDKQAFTLASSHAARFLRSCTDNKYLFFFYHIPNAPVLFRFIRISPETSFKSAVRIMREMVENELEEENDPVASSKLTVLANYLRFEENNKY